MKEKLEKYYKNIKHLPDDTILCFYMLHLFCALVSVVFVFDYKYAFINIPYVVLSSLIYLAFFIKRDSIKDKNKRLISGIITIIASLHCQLICAFFTPLKPKQIILLEIILLLSNIMVFILLVFIIKMTLKGKEKFSKTKPISIALIGLSSAAGMMLSRCFYGTDNSKYLLIFGFILMSYVFSAVSIFLIDWYYINKLENLRKALEQNKDL